jgi:hypothetical protein
MEGLILGLRAVLRRLRPKRSRFAGEASLSFDKLQSADHRVPARDGTMRALRRVLLGALLKCATADVRRRNQSPLSLPRRHALQLRGGTATASAPAASTAPATTPTSVKKKHAYITPRELTQIMVADLAPHGMLPLAWAATRGAGTGVVPAVLLLAVFASSSAYTLYLAAQLAEAGREARRAAPALSELWRGAKLPLPKAVDAMVALLCGGCCVFYAAFAADLFYALAKRLGLGTSREMVLGVLTCIPLAPLCLGDDLSVLKYSSLAGLLGIAYTASFIGKNGVTSDVAPIPATQTCSGTLVLANTLVVAFLCHYNAVQYYRELAPRRRTPDKFRRAVFGRRPFFFNLRAVCSIASMAWRWTYTEADGVGETHTETRQK